MKTLFIIQLVLISITVFSSIMAWRSLRKMNRKVKINSKDLDLMLTSCDLKNKKQT